jgi:hypothetical protein
LSGAPNAKALQLLLEHAGGGNKHNTQAAYRMLHCQDIFGGTPLAYLCWNQAPGNQKLCKGVFDSMLVKTRLAHIGLNDWKQVIRTNMSYALEHWDDDKDYDTTTEEHHDYCDRLELVARVFFALEYHERNESLSLLECWLWKLRWNHYCDSSSLQEEQDQEDHRQQCRIHCAADIVIPNVLSFLPPLEEGKYLKSFATKLALL